MAKVIGLGLILYLFSFTQTEGKTTVHSKDFTLTTYGCKGLYEFKYAVTIVNFTSPFLKRALRFEPVYLPASLKIPANMSVPFGIQITNSTGVFLLDAVQNSTETCCSDNLHKMGNCYELSLSCPENCNGGIWPTYPSFYQASGCGDCLCVYCSVVNERRMAQFVVTLPSRTHLFNVDVSSVYLTTTEIIWHSKTVLPSPHFNRNTTFLPVPKDDLFEEYFKIYSENGTYKLQVNSNKSLPLNGRASFYIDKRGSFDIIKYNLIWYSQLSCNISAKATAYLNAPLLTLTCGNPIGKPIDYSVSNPEFQMIGNKLHFKDLRAYGDKQIEISAMYKDRPDSAYRSKLGFNVSAKFPILRVFGCKAKFNLTLLNYTKITLHNQEIGLNVTLFHRPPSYSIDLLQNRTDTIELYLNDQRYMMRANSSETCCKETVTQSRNCYTINLICPKRCEVPRWIHYPGFYQTSNCDNCSCLYCYIGNVSGTYESVLPLTASTHLLEINVSAVSKETFGFIRPRREFLTSVRLPSMRGPLLHQLPTPRDVLFEHSLIYNGTVGYIQLINKLGEMLPPHGRIQLYYQPIEYQQKAMKIYEYDVTWFPPIKCNFTDVSTKYRNDSFLHIDCENEIQRPIVYNVSNRIFQIKNDSVYLKNLTASGSYNISIIAMYAGVDGSETMFNLSFNLEDLFAEYPFLTLPECKTRFNLHSERFKDVELYTKDELIVNFLGNPIYWPKSSENQTVFFAFKLDVGPATSLKATTSETCCHIGILQSTHVLCFTLLMLCSEPCPVFAWPDEDDFYKYSECQGCECSYCYIGGTPRQKTINTTFYQWKLRVPVTVNHEFIHRFSWDTMNSSIHLGIDASEIFPVLWGGTFQKYFEIDYIHSMSLNVIIRPQKDIQLPSDGEIKLYYDLFLDHIDLFRQPVLYKHTIFWYSPVHCTVSYMNSIFINDPLFSIDCANTIRIPIEFSQLNSNFQMKDNYVYLKELTTSGSLNISVIAMYEGLPDSATIINVTVTTKVISSLMKVYGCTAVIDGRFLNLTDGYVLLNVNQSTNTYWKTDGIHRIVSLPPNATTVIDLFTKDQNMTFNIRVKSETCCKNASIQRQGMCYNFQFSCEELCKVSDWPVFSGFYKTSKCDNCSCQYCDIADAARTQMLSVPLVSSEYLMAFTTQVRVIKNYNSVQHRTNVHFRNYVLKPIPSNRTSFPLPWNSSFVLKKNAQHFIINPIANVSLPKYGTQQLYFYTQGESYLIVERYNLTWYSPIHITMNSYDVRYLNSELLHLVYKEALNFRVVFNIKNPEFQMVANYVFLKELTTRGSHNLSISAMYHGISESLTTIKHLIRLEGSLPQNSFPLSIINNQAVINTTFLSFRKLNIFSKTLPYNRTFTSKQTLITIPLPDNQTRVFSITMNGSPALFTLTATFTKVCRNVEIVTNRRFNCYKLILHCPDLCTGIFPDSPQFYVSFRETKCAAYYCFRGGHYGVFKVKIAVKTQYNYTMAMGPTQRNSHIVQYLIGSKGIEMRGMVTGDKYLLMPTKYMKYFTVIKHRNVSLLTPILKENIPEGHFTLSISLMNSSFIHETRWSVVRDIVDYNIYVFNKVYCTIEKFEYADKLPLPVCRLNCTNALNIGLNYTIDKPHVFVNDSVMYMTRPSGYNVTFNISVFYADLDQSVSSYAVSVTTKKYSMSLKTITSVKDLIELIKTMASVEIAHHRPGKHIDFVIRTTSGKGIVARLNSLSPRGVIILDMFTPVGQLFIANLSAVKDSRHRYVFTCYTNSTVPDLTYEWYWNDVQVSMGLSSSMVDGKSQGTIVFDQLNENDSGNVTCHVRGKHFIPDTHTISIIMKDFPVVELTTTSEIIHNKNPVNVSCKLLGPSIGGILHFNYSVKVESLNAVGSVSITKATNFTCYAVKDTQRGEIKKLKISMAIGKKLCPKETTKKLKWPETVAESRANVTCSGEFSGTASRFCSTNGIWESPKVECIKNSILDAKSSLGRMVIGMEGNLETAVENLANATKDSMKANDISVTIEALELASIITDNRKEVTSKNVRGFVDVISNLVSEDTKPAWTKLEKENKITAATVMKQMEEFGNIASQKINETMSISTKNLVIELAKVNVDNDIEFPSPNPHQEKWVTESNSNVFLPSSILKNNFGANESVTVNAVLFRNITDLLPKYENTSSIVNSVVLSISLGKPLENLTEKIALNFSHLSKKYKEPLCNFWDFNINPDRGGYWSNRGCQIVTTDSDYTVCSCDHLTNFAILMKPVSHENHEVLSIITDVGCSISIVALVLTIIAYAICWKYVTSQDVAKSQSILLMHLCVALIIAYVIFLSLAEGPREKGVCIAIAALLQYFFLVVFFIMLAEGIDMAITLTVVFTYKHSRLPWLLVLSWVTPFIIVGISLWSTMTVGFGNEKFCWLTPKDNVIWAFIGPALAIILANIVCVIFIVKALLSTYCMLRESSKQRLRSGARAIGILTPLLGFTWIVGVFSVSEHTIVFEYIFTISTALQGLFIFFAYCICNKRIRKNICKIRKPTSQVTTKPSTQSTSNSDTRDNTRETRLTNSARKEYSSIEEPCRDSTEIMFKNSIYGARPEDMELRASIDNGLKKPIFPYYVNPSSAWHNDKL